MTLCLDIGGSKIAIGLVQKGKVLHYQKFQWPRKITQRKFLNQIFSLIENYKLKIGNFTVIAVAIAGQVNQKGEVYLTRHLLAKETKINLKKILEEKFNLPVYLDNDANCFVLGESFFGQVKKNKNIIGLTLGSGIGGGIIFDKKIYRGQHGYAGEFGHMIIQANGEKCSFGKRGCWEAYASSWGIRNFYQKITGQKKSSEEIVQEFLKKKKSAVAAIKKTAFWLALDIANIINVLDPEVIIFGGGLARFRVLISLAWKEAKKWLVVSSLRPKILISLEPEKMTLLGASLLPLIEKRNKK